MKRIILLIPLFFVLFGCNIPVNIDKEYIIKNFTQEEIIFFWETAFSNNLEYREYIKDNQFKLMKWNTDIRIHTFGNVGSEDSLGVENAIAELNKLNLPIKAYWDQEKKDSANYEIFFGTKEYIEQSLLERSISVNIEGIDYPSIVNFVPKGRTNILSYGFMGIRADILPSAKSFAILNKLLNSLGLRGGSFSYPESILNDAMITDSTILRRHLAEIDKRALSLLYAPAIPCGTSRRDFYKIFSDILPKRNTILESDYTGLVNYLISNQVSEDVINTFYNQAFISSVKGNYPHISKWAVHPVIHFSDSTSLNSQKIIREGVKLFNPLLPEKQKIIFQPHDTFPYNVCVNNQGKSTYVESYDSKGIQMAAVLIGDIPYPADENERNLLTTKAMMELLGGAYKQSNEFPREMARNICDTNYIRFFLSPVVKTGMKQEIIKEHLQKYYKMDKQLEIGYKVLDAYLSKRPLSDSVSNCLIQLLGDSTFGSYDVIHKWNSLKIGTPGNQEEQVKLLKFLCSAVPFVKIQVVNADSCNLSVSFVEDVINSVSYDEITVKDAIRFGHARIINRTGHIFPWVYSAIFGFNVAKTDFIKQFDKGVLTLEPHWLEALKFYYSPYIRSGMKKDKIVEILRKYYDLKTANKIDYDMLESYLSKKPLADSSMLYVKNKIKQQIESRLFIPKMESVRIGLSEQAQKDSAIINSLCNSLAPVVDIRLSSRDSCNIFISYSSEDGIKSYISTDHPSDQCYIATTIPEKYSSSGQYNIIADHILGDIFTCCMEKGMARWIANFDGKTFTFEPYWLEALKFYYSPYIQPGMKKEKVMELILKYYPDKQ